MKLLNKQEFEQLYQNVKSIKDGVFINDNYVFKLYPREREAEIGNYINSLNVEYLMKTIGIYVTSKALGAEQWLVLEKAQGITLGKLIKTMTILQSNLLITHICYIIGEMNSKYHITHYDLHPENILIEIGDLREYVYNCYGEYYSITSPYSITIIDFGSSYLPIEFEQEVFPDRSIILGIYAGINDLIYDDIIDYSVFYNGLLATIGFDLQENIEEFFDNNFFNYYSRSTDPYSIVVNNVEFEPFIGFENNLKDIEIFKFMEEWLPGIFIIPRKPNRDETSMTFDEIRDEFLEFLDSIDSYRYNIKEEIAELNVIYDKNGNKVDFGSVMPKLQTKIEIFLYNYKLQKIKERPNSGKDCFELLTKNHSYFKVIEDDGRKIHHRIIKFLNYIEDNNINVDFEGHSVGLPSSDKIESYIDSLPYEDRYFMSKVLSNLKYVNYEQFKKRLITIFQNFAKEDIPYDIFIPSSFGSEYWIITLLRDYITDSNFNKYVYNSDQNLNYIHNIAYIDDAIYTGQHMYNNIKDLLNTYKKYGINVKNITLHINCVAVSGVFFQSKAYHNLEDEFEKVSLVSIMILPNIYGILDISDESIKWIRKYQMHNTTTTLYFDHKIANDLGSIPQILLKCYNPRNEESYVKMDFKEFANNHCLLEYAPDRSKVKELNEYWKLVNPDLFN